MTKTEILRERALKLTRAQSTESIVEAFAMGDAKIDEIRATTPFDEDEYLAVVTARGFMMDVLDERGEIDLVMGEDA